MSTAVPSVNLANAKNRVASALNQADSQNSSSSSSSILSLCTGYLAVLLVLSISILYYHSQAYKEDEKTKKKVLNEQKLNRAYNLSYLLFFFLFIGLIVFIVNKESVLKQLCTQSIKK